jgi:hypothetical protein
MWLKKGKGKVKQYGDHASIFKTKSGQYFYFQNRIEGDNVVISRLRQTFQVVNTSNNQQNRATVAAG